MLEQPAGTILKMEAVLDAIQSIEEKELAKSEAQERLKQRMNPDGS